MYEKNSQIPKSCRLCGVSHKSQTIRADTVFGGKIEHNFWQCRNCDAVYLYSIPSIEEEAYFYKKEFDIIIAFHVLEYIPNPTKFIKLLISVLKENSLLFIEIPNQDYLWKKYFEPHVLFFGTNSLKVLLRKLSLCDFKIVSCGRRLQNIPKERTVKKLFRHQVGKNLYSMGLKRPSLKKKNVIDEEKLRKLYKMDQFGQERQWLRAVVKK